MMNSKSVKKIMIVSLGCDKNLVDTEKMMGVLRETSGRYLYEFTDDENECDAIVVNTCCFIGDAKVESINSLIGYGKVKADPDTPCRFLIAAGCLVKRYRSEILTELPEVDGLIDLKSLFQIQNLLDDLFDGKKICQEDYLISDDLTRPCARILTGGGYSSYLKIADGCNKFCTYCVIPKVRGAYYSVPMEQLVAEAEELAQKGIRELILVAQEITCYGVDLYGEKKLCELLHRLCGVEGIRWIRLMYCYPEEITPELIDCIASEDKILHYIDMPIQHASDRILKKMGRKTDQASIQRVIANLRDKIPDICIRTTLISGFPGETEEDHENLLDFVDSMEFDRLGVFPYSKEEDTAASRMRQQVPEEVKIARKNEIMELQQEISLDKSNEIIGKELVCIVEGKVADEAVYVGRSYRDAPGIDGFVFIDISSPVILMSGDLVKVKITGAEEYDLIGELIENEFT